VVNAPIKSFLGVYFETWKSIGAILAVIVFLVSLITYAEAKVGMVDVTKEIDRRVPEIISERKSARDKEINEFIDLKNQKIYERLDAIKNTLDDIKSEVRELRNPQN